MRQIGPAFVTYVWRRDGGLLVCRTGVECQRLRHRLEPAVENLMAPAAWFVLVPLAHASLLSGIALSVGTSWGL